MTPSGGKKLDQTSQSSSRPHPMVGREEEYLKAIRAAFSNNFEDDILNPAKQDYNAHINKVKKYMEQKSGGITASQLRNFFSHVKRINDFGKLYTVRPLLAYAAGRAEEKKQDLKEMLFFLDALVKKVDSPEKLKQFKSFFESVIAYHKYFGGKE